MQGGAPVAKIRLASIAIFDGCGSGDRKPKPACKGGELKQHPNPTKIYCLDETPDTGAEPTPRPPVRAGRRRDSGKNIWGYSKSLKLADICISMDSKMQLDLVAPL